MRGASRSCDRGWKIVVNATVLADLRPLLASGEAWNPLAAEGLVSQRLVALLPGAPWKGEDD